jgi:hypothetical protein
LDIQVGRRLYGDKNGGAEMIDFSTLQELTISEGSVVEITNENGEVIWSAKRNAIVTITSECNGIEGDTAHIKIVSDTVLFEAYAYDLPDCTIEVPVGATIECTVSRSKANADSSISLNGTKVLTEGTYIYTVTGNVAIHVSDRYSMGEYGVITITE